jgi:uncharacterized protein
MIRMTTLGGRFAVCRLSPGATLPTWPSGTFVSITRTPDELSIVCDESSVPDDVRAERDWRALRVEGPIPFEVTGVAAGICAPLAAAGISVFLVATFDTDYVLVKADTYGRAVDALRETGITVQTNAL